MGKRRDFTEPTLEIMYRNLDNNAGSFLDFFQDIATELFDDDSARLAEDMSNLESYMKHIMEVKDITREKLDGILRDVAEVEGRYSEGIKRNTEELRTIQNTLQGFMARIEEVAPIMPENTQFLPDVSDSEIMALTIALIKLYGLGATIDGYLDTPEKIAQARLDAERAGITLPLTKEQLAVSDEIYEELKEREEELPDGGVVIHNPAAEPPGTGRPSDTVPRDIPCYNYPGNRSAEAYTEVMDELGVTTEDRYRPRSSSDTFCNFFVWDVTIAMGCEIPHTYDMRTGEKVTRDPNNPNPNHVWMNANRMCDWLKNFGAGNGWNHIVATHNPDGTPKTKWQIAIEMANQGYPVILAWKSSGPIGHVAMVAPQRDTDIGTDRVMIYQAGATNYAYTDLVNGFGHNLWDDIEIYWHQ